MSFAVATKAIPFTVLSLNGDPMRLRERSFPPRDRHVQVHQQAEVQECLP